MKFTDGVWMAKPGVDVHGCSEIRDIQFSGDTPTFFISPFSAADHGQTPGGPLLTLKIGSPRQDILEITYSRYPNTVPRPPGYEIFTEPQELEFTETEAAYTVLCGKIAAILTKGRFALTFTYNNKVLTRSGFKQAACLTTPDGPFMRERLGLGVDETVYGLGERFTPFVKNGQSIDIRNEDSGTSFDIRCRNIPFYVSGKGYGVFTNHSERVSYEIASESASRVQFSVPGEELRYCVIGGGSVKAAVSNYRALTGKPSLPPAWSFGLCLTVPFIASLDEEKFSSLINGIAEHDIPLSGIYFNSLLKAAVSPETENAVERCRSKNINTIIQNAPSGYQREDTYEAMAETLRGALSLALCGSAFRSHDIGGFESAPAPELCKRWMAFGLFSACSRLHAGHSCRVPWLMDDETVNVLRTFTKIKNSLMPYLFAEAVKAAQTGVPVMRPMVMEYPGDSFCHTLDKQYMLGGSLLVAPVFHEDGHCDVYLPDGMFTNFFTDELVQGGRLVKGRYNTMTLPVFIPENTLLAMGRDDCAEYDFHENVTIHAYQLTEQTTELYDKTGTLRATVTGRSHGDDVTFQVDGEAPGLKFEVHRGGGI